MDSIVVYAMLKKYVEDTAIALGAVKGSPCRIQSIVEDDDKSTITFAWTGTDGTNKTSILNVKNGLKIAGTSPDNRLVEIVEIEKHPWAVGVIYHPEFKSRPNKCHPLFREFIAKAKKIAK